MIPLPQEPEPVPEQPPPEPGTRGNRPPGPLDEMAERGDNARLNLSRGTGLGIAPRMQPFVNKGVIPTESKQLPAFCVVCGYESMERRNA